MPAVDAEGRPDYAEPTEKELIAEAVRQWNLKLEQDPFAVSAYNEEAITRPARNAEFAGGPSGEAPKEAAPKGTLDALRRLASRVPSLSTETAAKVGNLAGPLGAAALGGAAASINAVTDAAKLREKELIAKAQAAKESGSAPALAGDPNMLLEGQGQPQRLLGYTKGGFQPTTNSRSAQTERKAMPPEWYESLDAFTDHARAGATGQAIGETEMARIQAGAAAKRSAMLARQAETEQLALEQEDKARQAAEFRIQSALADYAASAPKAENYGTLFANTSPGMQMAGALGGILSIFGGAMAGQESLFHKQLDSMIERRARAAEANSKIKGDLAASAENAYSRLERSFGDQRAARSALRGIYAEQAKAAFEQQAADLGISMENPRLQAALAAVEEKRLGYLKETASTVVESARADERYVPPQAIVSAATGFGGMDAGLTKDQRDELRAFGKILREEGIPQARAAVALMKEASDEIGDDSTFWANVASANPGTISQLYTRFSSPAQQKYLSAYNDFLANKSGKAVTQSEGSRFTALLGRGDKAARDTAIGIMDSGIQGQIRTLQETGWDAQSQTWQRHKAYNDQRGRSGLDIRGVASPQSATEPPPVERK